MVDVADADRFSEARAELDVRIFFPLHLNISEFAMKLRISFTLRDKIH